MMGIRTHLAIHGEEYLPIWEYKLRDPSSNKQIYNPVISYSNFYGMPTANLYAQATSEHVIQPLCPKLIKGTRNKLKHVVIYIWYTDSNILKIGGAKLTFDNGDIHIMGTVTKIVESFNLGDKHIIQVTAYDQEKIDGLKFVLSNESVHRFGQMNSNSNYTFQLKDHHIPSFYLSSDSKNLGGQAANIAVSYQWYNASL